MKISDIPFLKDCPEKLDLVNKALENRLIPMWLYDLLRLEQKELCKKYPLHEL